MRLDNKLYSLDAIDFGKELVGKILVREVDGIKIRSRIVEVEAYNGEEDKANHAFKNLKSKRTEPMFLEGGYVYVFLIYGMYSCFNVVCGEENKPHAVLIRAVEPLDNLNVIKQNRPIKSKKIEELTNGPGKLTKALKIDKNHNRIDLKTSSEIYIETDEKTDFQIVEAKRVNIDYAKEYKDKLWRFYIKDSPYVSVK